MATETTPLPLPRPADDEIVRHLASHHRLPGALEAPAWLQEWHDHQHAGGDPSLEHVHGGQGATDVHLEPTEQQPPPPYAHAQPAQPGPFAAAATRYASGVGPGWQEHVCEQPTGWDVERRPVGSTWICPDCGATWRIIDHKHGLPPELEQVEPPRRTTLGGL